jgi:hypothetical protein
MEEEKKKIDDSWKEQVEKEKAKEEAGTAGNEEAFLGQPDFSFFITTLSIQASIALGAIPNPVSKQKEENLNQAKLIIDTLGMLKEKTQGNLNTEEDSLLDNMLYELRMFYLSKTKEQK